MDLDSLKHNAQTAVDGLCRAFEEALEMHEDGLSVTEISNMLGIKSRQKTQKGEQRDYLAYSIFGKMMDANIVIKTYPRPKRPKYILKKFYKK